MNSSKQKRYREFNKNRKGINDALHQRQEDINRNSTVTQNQHPNLSEEISRQTLNDVQHPVIIEINGKLCMPFQQEHLNSNKVYKQRQDEDPSISPMNH
ncbi:unnamed protein product [Rotaria sp. Silwood2]|nr:unnamed protein product [Rotaria sp. Silwood2]CAF2924924.1 unnamed protein product [Rotaria sp. Silwood2]CAF3188582.1 unnamed protein product [Rotaria sp. Silwood2]CAF3325532.1 unnamed protein product [Rotaria sp. Silwood2]CAF4057957.1 unnamed protein product [Rotaria sp. Silwood2]